MGRCVRFSLFFCFFFLSNQPPTKWVGRWRAAGSGGAGRGKEGLMEGTKGKRMEKKKKGS